MRVVVKEDGGGGGDGLVAVMAVLGRAVVLEVTDCDLVLGSCLLS